jgi:hypothetical protein
LWLDGGEEDLSYRPVSITVPEGFAGSGHWYSADPRTLTVDQTYRFTVVVEVTRMGDMAGGALYHKPPVNVMYGRQQWLGTETGQVATITAPSGAKAVIRSAQDASMTTVLQSPWLNIDVESVAARVGVAEPTHFGVYRGRKLLSDGTVYQEVSVEAEGGNMSAVTVTTPTGKTLDLDADGPGGWELWYGTTDAALLADFVNGVYTFTCTSTQDGSTRSFQVDMTDVPDPTEYPVLTSPTGNTTDPTPTFTWNAPTDPNVNWIIAGIENDDLGDETESPVTITSWAPSVEFPLGGCEPWVVFANLVQGTTPEGVGYSVARYTSTSELDTFNIVPFNVTATLDWDWVYPNTPTTTQDRHQSVLTVEVTNDPQTGQDYTSLVTERANDGRVTPLASANPLVWTIRGGQRGAATPGSVTLDVLVRGVTSGLASPAVCELTLRALGDVDGDGLVNSADKLEMNKRLNGLANLPGITLRALDLSGDGALVNAEDKLAINQVLNGLVVP